MDIQFEKMVEDVRGKIFFFSHGNKKFHLVEIKKGFARGGHYHKFDQLHVILTGKIEYHKAEMISDNEEKKIINPPDVILIPASISHLFVALEDSSFIEIFEDKYEATEYQRFRRIVEERMKVRLLEE